MEMLTDPRQKIEDVLESIRPALRSDGGDVELIDFDEDDGIVQLRLVGACGSCPGLLADAAAGNRAAAHDGGARRSGASSRSDPSARQSS
jgi:hypothetical protein